MGRDEILAFLEAIDAELVTHAGEGERLDFYLIGRSALILRYGLNIGTKDVDIVHFHGSQLELKAVELFGKGTRNAERFGFYLEPVPQGLPPIPGGYRPRSEEIPGRWRVLRPRQPEPHDLAVTKLKRFHAKDREDLQILCDAGTMGTARPAPRADRVQSPSSVVERRRFSNPHPGLPDFFIDDIVFDLTFLCPEGP